MQSYVAGFMFSPSEEEVVLVRKRKPSWQAGSLNGVGGKIDPGETADQAMVREFQEETGLHTHGWQHFASLTNAQDYMVHFYRMQHPWYAFVQSRTDEEIEIKKVLDLHRECMIPNLRWLIPLAKGTQSEE